MFTYVIYIVSVLICLVFVLALIRLYLNLSKKDAEEFPMGIIVKYFSDFLLKLIKKFLNVDEDSKLLIIIICLCIIVFGVIKAIG